MFERLVDDAMGLSDAELDAAIRANELERRRVEAAGAALVAVSASRGAFRMDGQRSINSYLKATCNVSGGAASQRRRLSEVCDAVPALGDALVAGRIGVDQVVEIARIHANPRTREFFQRVAPIYLEFAEHDSHRVLHGRIDDFLQAADHDGAFAAIVCDIEERVAHVNVVGGTLDVKVRGGDPLVADEFVAIFELFVQEEFAADVAARRAEHGDRADEFPLPRTDRQRRYDAMIAMARHARNNLAEGKPAGAAEVVTNLVADVATWWDALDQAGVIATRDGRVVELDDDTIDEVIDTAVDDPEGWVDRTCHTADGTPVPSILLLKAALTGLVRRVVVDADGVVVDRGRAARLFDGEARAAAMLLFRECSHPGCSVRVRWCEVDHVEEWWTGGRTNQTNADVRCRAHNRDKHRQRWRSRKDEHGRRFTIRSDGTIMLPVGARPPDLTDDELAHHIRQRLHTHLANAS